LVKKDSMDICCSDDTVVGMVDRLKIVNFEEKRMLADYE
jgi:hypothetical protein